MRIGRSTLVVAGIFHGCGVCSVASRLSAGKEAQHPVHSWGTTLVGFNVGAYHRGMMSGKTPEPRQTGLPGDDIHRLLRRGKLHGGAS